MDAIKDLEMYKRKLKRLKELKEKEPDNTYHDWNAEIAQCEHNIAECVIEQFSILGGINDLAKSYRTL